MEMKEIGLINELNKMYLPKKDSFCYTKTSSQKAQKFRLNLKSLASAFAVLVAGYVISLTAFVGERTIRRQSRIQIRHS